MGANTKYKNSLFSFLFSNADVLRELYCALEGITLPNDVPVTINTLQDVLFMDQINDISFEIAGKLVILIEHQSTINPNMGLRLLMYIARVYEKIIDRKTVYSSKLKRLPRPEFFVLYNGTEEYPDEKTLKLSDAYENIQSLGLPENTSPALELVVKVLNINHGRNAVIVRKCETLAMYSAFVGKVQEYEKAGMGRGEAINNAIKYCMENDILKEFLEQNASEVLNMLLTEWNMDDALEVRYEEGREEGLEEGREEGREECREEGREKGREEVARKALAEGLTFDLVQKISGLDLETLKNIKTRQV